MGGVIVIVTIHALAATPIVRRQALFNFYFIFTVKPSPQSNVTSFPLTSMLVSAGARLSTTLCSSAAARRRVFLLDYVNSDLLKSQLLVTYQSFLTPAYS